MNRKDAVLLNTNCTINSYDYGNLKHTINKVYDDFKNNLEELRTICKNSIVMCEADGTCILTDTKIMEKINKMIKECEYDNRN